MTKLANVLWRHLRRSLTADPGRFAGGSAVNDPLSVLAIEQERMAARRPRPGPAAARRLRTQPGRPARSRGLKQRHRHKEHIMRADIFPGGTFPDYEPTDHTKTRHRLSELQGIDPMILVLSRGGFCPKDHQQHLELAANYPKIRVAYTQIVTISTDNILKTSEFRDSVGAQWTFLSDAGRHIQKDLDIAEYTDSYYDPAWFAGRAAAPRARRRVRACLGR